MTPNGAVYYTVYDRLKARRIKQIEARRERDRALGKPAVERGDRGNHAGKPRVEQHYMMLFGAVAGAAARVQHVPV